MVDLILLGLVGATAVLFSALTLDEVTSRMHVRRSNRTSRLSPNDVANQPTREPVADDRKKEAA